MKDEEYCVRFPLDFFDDARVKVIEAMPSGDTIICLWIRFLFLRVRAMDMDGDGAYLLRCEDGRTLTEEELCRIPTTRRRPHTTPCRCWTGSVRSLRRRKGPRDEAHMGEIPSRFLR